ncbi:MAG TPA: long-chain fatty acid--CoA ligase [Gemmatimonadales bacterium]|jgi:long-chain acyl-CoA synthetase
MTAPWLQHYDDGVPHKIDFVDQPLDAFLRSAAREFPDRDALIFMNGRLTFRALDDAVDRFATAIVRLGATTGTRVAIQLPNLPQFVIAYYGTLRAGAVATPTNPLYTSGEIEHQWKDAGAEIAVVADFVFASRVAPIRNRLPVREYIVAAIPEYLRFPLNVLAPFRLRRQSPPLSAPIPNEPVIHRFRRLVDATAADPPSPPIRMDDPCTLLYTGGTTGVSKGATLTHRNLSYNAQQLIAWTAGLERGGEVVLAMLPLFHSYGLTVAMNLGIGIAATQVLIPNPRDIPRILKAISKHRVTLAPAVPASYSAMVQHPNLAKYDLSSVKVCNSGSAPLPVEILERFEQITGGKITEGFGLTETSPVTHSNPVFGLRKPGSIGTPLPSTEARIVNAEDGMTAMPTNEVGELILRGPQVMRGYWNRPEADAEMLRDGWLYTGDLARMDEDGFFFIVGRKKDMIICSGFNVYPDEVDRMLMSHPAVLEAGTIGIPDPKRGETVKSFVVLRPGQTATEEELMAFCREGLAGYKVPRAIEFRVELPRSGVLKILRRQLRAEELAKHGT